MVRLRSLVAMALLLCTLVFGATACSRHTNLLDPDTPVTINIWHNYGGQMQASMDSMMNNFNQTVGKEQGIVLNVTAISSSSQLADNLVASAKKDPTAQQLPNIAVCYPATAEILRDAGALVDLTQYFTTEQLQEYVPQFLQEGYLGEGLYVFPISKSTEVLFLDKTLLDRAGDVLGVAPSDLSDFESLADLAMRYYAYTDGKTPEILQDGKAFYTSDSICNYFQVGMDQLDRPFIVDGNINSSDPVFHRIWESIFRPAVAGGFAIVDGYSSDLSKVGEILCSTGSTAGILFYGTQITYPDNTVEDVEYEVLPYPTFSGGKAVAMQRGSGMCVLKSTEQEELACSIFLSWFTQPQQNMQLVSSTGYLPVTNEAFSHTIESSMESIANENIRKLLQTAVHMYRTYDFMTPPNIANYSAMSKNFEKQFKKLARECRTSYIELCKDMHEEQAYSIATEGAFEAFCATL